MSKEPIGREQVYAILRADVFLDSTDPETIVAVKEIVRDLETAKREWRG